jgi:hypothetical protein
MQRFRYFWGSTKWAPLTKFLICEQDGDPAQMSKFNAQAVRSFQLLEARAKRLEKLIARLENDDVHKSASCISKTHTTAARPDSMATNPP